MEGLESLPQAAFQDLVVLTFKILAEEETEEAIAGPFSPKRFGAVSHGNPLCYCCVCGTVYEDGVVGRDSPYIYMHLPPPFPFPFLSSGSTTHQLTLVDYLTALLHTLPCTTLTHDTQTHQHTHTHTHLPLAPSSLAQARQAWGRRRHLR